MASYTEVVMWIGYATLIYFAIKLLITFIKLMRVYYFVSYPDFSKYGKWSVITGSTHGIGKALAMQNLFQLASRGQNIVLLARNKQKLEEVSQEISTKHNVEVKTIQVDFGDDEAIYQTIEDSLKGLDIGVLINNVGIIGPPTPSVYGDINNLSDVIRSIIRLNVTSLLKMIQIVLPGMANRKRGLIINMSSGVAKFPFPEFSLYGSTKSFVEYFSKTLSYEYKSKGITVQTCTPGGVTTNAAMDNYAQSSSLTLTPEAFAKSLLSTVGKERETYGALPHFLAFGFMQQLPQFVINRFLAPSYSALFDDKKSK